jgi:ParB-like chromosome segregation protein Spo0J
VDYKLIDPMLIDADPHNMRVISPKSVDEMSESIKQHGLLQNLVVEKRGERYVCRAGNCRLLAIRKLMAEGVWKEKGVVCLVVGDGSWSQIVENVVRQDVPLWRLGARLQELRAAGYTKRQIAVRCGMSEGKTSMLMQIAEGLAPEIITKIEQMPPSTLTITQLCNLARLFNPETLRPDVDAQNAMLAKLLNRPRSRTSHNRPVTERQTVWRRYKKLRDNSINIPVHAEPYVDAVVRYLCGEDQRLRVIR